MKREGEEQDDEVVVKRSRVDGEEDVHGTALAPKEAEADHGAEPKKYALKLNNMDKNATSKDVQKLLERENVPYLKVKKVHGLTYGEVTFSSQEARDDAIVKIQGQQIKKTSISVEILDKSIGKPPVKRDNAISNGNANTKPDDRTPQERINDQVIPLWRKSYEEQLTEKANRFSKCLGLMKKKLLQFLQNRDITPERREALSWVKELVLIFLTNFSILRSGKSPVCTLEPVVKSPKLEGYRTKCEFSIGYDLDGKKAIGFLLGLFKDGITTVLGPADCSHVSPKAKDIVKIMETVLHSSPLDVYDRSRKTGFWRLMQVRTHESGESMVIVQVNPANIDESQRAQARNEVLKAFELAKQNGTVAVSTILWQDCDGVHNGLAENFEILYGPGYVHENLLGIRFRISPQAFFQVNTEGTEKLYSKVIELCTESDSKTGGEPAQAASATGEVDGEKSTKNTVLLDLCCGTGTIGLAMASKMKKVIGVEIVKEAVADAQQNAAANGIVNVTYLAAKVEDAIREVFSQHVDPEDHVVAVLDPPRNGVGSGVIQAIRACEKLNRVIYISCDADQALDNFVE
ncbi:tRNA methyltransferase 2 [Blyttiomyces sp. JEL0837]|nr:tRNA methyltransferase 2 [Blyttiomyces sp. JEL0837]